MRTQLDDADAQVLAHPFKMKAGKKAAVDPCPLIPPALLSADHITEYVSKTGMIAPFDNGGYEKSPLKAASYESKIGKHAYIFEKGVNYPSTIYDGTQQFLEVPANSIVFVESDIYFRLPSFIAVRFNLQINHVHRGLLLGTGPLVDPGFWGRLCIPLHNLTNKSYLISRDDGLIWIEFTKTSSTPISGRPPSNTEFPNIKKFIEKASKPINEDEPPIAIRSSIPDMVIEAEERSKEAATSAMKSEISANKSLNITKSVRNWSQFGVLIGAVSVIALAVTVVGTSLGYYNSTQIDIANIKILAEKSDNAIQQHVADVDNFGNRPIEARASIPELRYEIQNQSTEIQNLNAGLRRLEVEVDKLKPKSLDPKRPIG